MLRKREAARLIIAVTQQDSLPGRITALTRRGSVAFNATDYMLLSQRIQRLQRTYMSVACEPGQRLSVGVRLTRRRSSGLGNLVKG